MRARSLRGIPVLALLPLAATTLGCGAEKEAADPGAFVRAETVNRIGPPSRASSRTVRCGCDADGGLHVSAPQGSRVTVPDDAIHPAEAEVVMPEERAAMRIRTTKSLGFIGDNKLTQTPSRGGPWNVPNALLPPHHHVEPHYGAPRGYGYAPAPPGYPYGHSVWTDWR